MSELKVPQIYMPLFDGTVEKKGIRYVLLWGGRAGGRSVQAAAKFMLDMSNMPKNCRGMAARWRFNSLKDSSKAEIEAAIDSMGIPARATNDGVRMSSGAEISYDQLADIGAWKSIKNLVRVWVEEAQFVEKKENLIALDNTLRPPEGSGIEPLMILSMNRITPHDPAWDFIASQPDDKKLVIYATIDDNPFAPHSLVETRDNAKQAMEENRPGAMTREEYQLEWEGIPSNVSADGLYNYAALEKAKEPHTDNRVVAYIAGQDLAYGGTDACVFTCIAVHPDGHKSYVSHEKWQAITAADTRGRIMSLVRAARNPAILGLDAGDGGGMMMKTDLDGKLGNTQVKRFIPGDGKVFPNHAGNTRAYASLMLSEAINEGKIHNLPQCFIEDMSPIRKRRASEGKIYIERKEDLRKRMGKSPDLHDSLVIANYFADEYIRTQMTSDYAPYSGNSPFVRAAQEKRGVQIVNKGRFARKNT